MAALTNAQESLRVWWEGATPATRALAVGMAAVIVVGLILAVVMAAGPDFKPIYHNVSAKEAATIEAALREKNIPMRYDDMDKTISVASKDEGEAITAVEAVGALSQGSKIDGIESLDKLWMGTSTEVERARILHANEGELARKLMRLDPVGNASVSISPGNSTSLFAPDVAPTASVILSVKPNETLSAQQVKGIIFLVAHAVTGLTPANITLTDQTGASLWKDNDAGDNAFGGGQPLEESAKYAERQRIMIQDALDRSLGPRKAIVAVNAELDYDRTKTHSSNSTPAASKGPPINVSRTEIDTLKAQGGVNKLSVAVLIDASVPAELVPGLHKTIAAAIGVTPGDASRLVTVQRMPFDTSVQKALVAQTATLASEQWWSRAARAGAVGLIACLLLFMLMRAGRGARRPFVEPQLAHAGGGANIGLLADGLDEHPLRIEDVFTETRGQGPRRGDKRQAGVEGRPDLKLESIQEMVSKNPESVALLLKGWMSEEARVA